MAIIFIVSSLTLLFKVVYGTNCPDGFDGHRDSCYFFSHGRDTWMGAYEYCHLINAILVEVEDQDEDMFLSAKVVALGGEFWIGLNDRFIEDEWVWQTSKTLLGNSSYTNWGPGQPSNGDSGENCAQINPASEQWVNTKCYHTAHFLCEKTSSNTGPDLTGRKK